MEPVLDMIIRNIDHSYHPSFSSVTDLKKYYKGDKELPAIDFNTYTLIVGQQRMSRSAYYTDKLTVRNGYNCVVVDLYVKSAGNSNNVITNMYYWSLCSKFYAKNVMVNINLQE